MPNQELIRQNKQFEKDVVEIAPGIWMAIGFALSNVFMIEGQLSVTLIDTTESTAAAEEILAAFRKITRKPIERIIYTHGHRDHICGTTVFAPDETVPIYASASFASDMLGIDANEIRPLEALFWRSQAQFAMGLDPEVSQSHGAGPATRPLEGLGAGFMPPNRFVTDRMELDLDGVRAELVPAPGETEDHMVVWLPDHKLLFGADNWYHAFPNLYSPRGTAFRDYGKWVSSLALMEEFEAEILAPGHTLPVIGAENVREVLSSTRAAILHVMRATTDLMNKGASMDEIATSVTLPPELAEKPWLKEFYGKVSWCARGFAQGTLGWYDGNPTSLGFIAPHTRAERMADMAGGVAKLLAQAKATDDLQWKLELVDHLILLGQPVEDMKIDAMEALAELEINAIARNNYLWEAERLRQGRARDGKSHSGIAA